MPCDKVDCQLKTECFDAYGKFKYPPCASESVEPNADSPQQLKAEISAMLSKWKHCCELGVDWYEVESADYERLQKLSAI